MIEGFDLNNISGLVFDCDGTLLDTLDVWRAAEEDLFAQIPFELSPEQEDAIHSVSVEQAARIFHETYGVGESTQAVFDHLESRLLAFYATDAKPLPGAVALVRAAREHGIPCVVVSSTPAPLPGSRPCRGGHRRLLQAPDIHRRCRRFQAKPQDLRACACNARLRH